MKNIFRFNHKDYKLLIIVIMIFNSMPLLMMVSLYLRLPLAPFLFIPYLFWINIPATIFTKLGIPYYKYEEFGALPQGIIGWALIVLFWVLLSFCLTISIKTVKTRKR